MWALCLALHVLAGCARYSSNCANTSTFVRVVLGRSIQGCDSVRVKPESGGKVRKSTEKYRRLYAG